MAWHILFESAWLGSSISNLREAASYRTHHKELIVSKNFPAIRMDQTLEVKTFKKLSPGAQNTDQLQKSRGEVISLSSSNLQFENRHGQKSRQVKHSSIMAANNNQVSALYSMILQFISAERNTHSTKNLFKCEISATVQKIIKMCHSCHCLMERLPTKKGNAVLTENML